MSFMKKSDKYKYKHNIDFWCWQVGPLTEIEAHEEVKVLMAMMMMDLVIMMIDHK